MSTGIVEVLFTDLYKRRWLLPTIGVEVVMMTRQLEALHESIAISYSM